MKRKKKEREFRDDDEPRGFKRFFKVVRAWITIPFLVFAVFIVWMLFFSEHNYKRIQEQQKKIDALKVEVKQNEDSAQYYIRKTQELNTDKETLEKIAREEYNMKRTNEDVYRTDIP